MAVLPAVKREHNLVIAHACLQKTTITLHPYRPLASSFDYFLLNAGLFEP